VAAVAEACRGLAFAHARGVLHRDPKPANILFGEAGQVVLVDWGLARVRGEQAEGTGPEGAGVAVTEWADPRATVSGQVFGTPAYMAPEMAAGRQDAVDERTDVYVLGAALFEVLTGRPPRTGATVMEILREAASGPSPRARDVNPSVPPALDSVCARAMARAPEDRYPSAAAFGRDLEAWLAGNPGLAPGESGLRRWVRSLWRGR
jgi:serine/threonine protein kinase